MIPLEADAETEYDDLFEATAPEGRIFADKGALDPLADLERVVARDEQERQLAAILNGVHEGYLPTTVSIYGPPGTGKTLTVRRLCGAFADRTERFGVEYVNLKECRTLFSAANEMLLELTGEQKQAYAGLDGVFAAIWEALEDYPEWTVLILDEIDHIQHDAHYDPNDFFYRLLRGEGKLQRDLLGDRGEQRVVGGRSAARQSRPERDERRGGLFPPTASTSWTRSSRRAVSGRFATARSPR